MATSVTIVITLNSPYTFAPASFSANLVRNPGSTTGITFTRNTSTTATSIVSTSISAGTYNFSISGMAALTVLGTLPLVTPIGTVNFNFNDIPSTISNVPFNYILLNGLFTNPIQLNIHCLHGSSLITMKDNKLKRIDEIREGDYVLSNGKYAKVLEVQHCWLSFNGIDHDALIFEKDAIGNSERLIIDAGHPICTLNEYKEKGFDALRPAGELYYSLITLGLNCDLIKKEKWKNIFINNELSRRYDLVLEDPFNTYIANGIIVQSKGYMNHKYGNFV